MNRLKSIRIMAWTAVLVCIGFFFFFSGIVPGVQRSPLGSASKNPTVATIGGPFKLTTHRGKTLTNKDLVGKPYLVFFGFTHCPDICPSTLFELTEMLKVLGPEANKITPLFITVDPERDTQELLASYLTSFDSRIIALRGTDEQTRQAVKAFAAYYKKVPMEKGSYTMNHTAGIYLIDANGKFIGTLDSHEPRKTRIQKLRRLANSAS